jgi:hypothetical protein
LFETTAGAAGALGAGELPPYCTIWLIEAPAMAAAPDGPMMKGPA